MSETQETQETKVDCPRCNGTGDDGLFASSRCSLCKGAKTIFKRKKFSERVGKHWPEFAPKPARGVPAAAPCIQNMDLKTPPARVQVPTYNSLGDRKETCEKRYGEPCVGFLVHSNREVSWILHDLKIQPRPNDVAAYDLKGNLVGYRDGEGAHGWLWVFRENPAPPEPPMTNETFTREFIRRRRSNCSFSSNLREQFNLCPRTLVLLGWSQDRGCWKKVRKVQNDANES